MCKRCFKCWGFNHNAKDCTHKITCPKCNGEHRFEDCHSEKSECVNCLVTIQKLNLDIDPCHDARDINCPVYLKRVEREREKVAY